MSDFPVNPHRSDPYGAFRFRVVWEGRVVAGVSKVSALQRTTEVVEHRSGGEPGSPHRIPGLTRFAPVTLERGLTHDTAFEEWAGQVFTYGQSAERDLVNYRKDIVLELFNAGGQLVMAYRLFRCWPSAYRAVPTLDGDRAAVAIQSLTLEVEGWERDRAVTEPRETPFPAPKPPAGGGPTPEGGDPEAGGSDGGEDDSGADDDAPEVVRPDDPRPDIDRPVFDPPRFDRPGFDRPGFDRPEIDRPGFDPRDPGFPGRGGGRRGGG